MHLPSPLAVLNPVRRAWAYFRTGVRLEGEAYLCEDSHSIIFVVPGPDPDPRPQHLDVDLSIWNARGEPVTIIDLAEMRILSRAPALRLAPFNSAWESVPLEPGAPPY